MAREIVDESAADVRGTYDAEALKLILLERERWTREELAEALARLPRRKTAFTTDSGIPIPDILDPATVGGDAFLRDVGYPGGFPFTRGPQATMYRGRLWTMRQFAGFGSPEDTNRRFKYLLEHGVHGLSTAFDMPSLMGYDPITRWQVVRSGRRESRSPRCATSRCSSPGYHSARSRRP